MTSDQMLAYLTAKGEEWVVEQRALHHPVARPLGLQLLSDLQAFFGEDVLDAARFASVGLLPNPGFYRELLAMGQSIPLDFSLMHGITFVDTVLLSERFRSSWSPALYFHELVHVVQYQILGAAGFMKRYVRGWAENGFRYEAIPLEKDAYELQERYQTRPKTLFSVRQIVSQRLMQRMST